MATFIPGETDNYPGTPLFTPDFSFLSQSLSQSQQTYDKAAATIKSTYGSVVNADLTNPDNIKARDSYVQQANKALKDLSMADLSLPQNQQSAQKVFSPFWEDDELVSDMSKTKYMKEQIKGAYSLLNSSDDKDRNRFWMTGVDYVNNGLDELSTAKRGDGSILRTATRTYIPNYDLMGFLRTKMGKDGIAIKISSSGPGGVKYTVTNGDGTQQLFEDWVEQNLQGNQAAQDVFRVEGTVQYENMVKGYQSQGMSKDDAHKAVAQSYMDQQRDHYKTALSNVSTTIPELKAKQDALYKDIQTRYSGGVPTDPYGLQLVQQYQSSKKSYESAINTQKDYKSKMADYDDPNSPEYQKAFVSMTTGGQGYYQNYFRNKYIRGAAQALRIENMSSDYTLDPIEKMNAELQKDYFHLKQGSSSPGTGTEANAPDPIQGVNSGLAVYGKDPITAYTRMTNVMHNTLDDFVGTQRSIINNLVHEANIGLSTKFLDNLESTLKTGNFTSKNYIGANSDLDKELQRLKDQKILPADASWKNPSSIYWGLTNYAKNFYFNQSPGSMRPEIFQLFVDQDFSAKKYSGLKGIYDEAQNRVSKDPTLQPMVKDGHFMSKEEYLRNKLGTSNEEDFVNHDYEQWAKQPRVNMGPGIGGGPQTYSPAVAKASFKSVGDEYDKLQTANQSKIGDIVKNYMDFEGAYMGRFVEYQHKPGEQDHGWQIAQQALTDDNLRDQVVTTDGVFPANKQLLNDAGANSTDLKRVLDLVKNNPGKYLLSSKLTNIGVDGTPSVVMHLNTDEIEKEWGKQFQLEKGTIDALNKHGLELNINPAKANLPELKTDFGVALLDSKIYDQNGIATAPEFVKKQGFDYKISKDPRMNSYIVTFSGPEFKNGAIAMSSPHTEYIPLTTTLQDLERSLVDNIVNIQKNNWQQLQNLKTSPGSIYQSASGSWSDYSKTLQ